MKTRRIAAGLIGSGIILLTGTAFATPGPDHKITICHSGNGKHFSAIKVDYAGARGHAKTDADDIIPAFEDFPGQGDQSILENQCNVETTTTTLPTPTTTIPSSSTTTTSLPTTTTLIAVSTSSTTVTTAVPTTVTTQRPASTTTVTVSTSSTVPSSIPPTSGPTTGLPTSLPGPTTVLSTVPPSIVETETLPVTGSEPTGLVYGGLVLLALGLILVIVSR